MCAAIETVLSSKTTHLLCQWHLLTNWKKYFMCMAMKGGTTKLVYNNLFKMIYTPIPTRFQKYMDTCFNHMHLFDDAKVNYLRRLFLIKDKWASAYVPGVFTGGNTTSFRVECVNSAVKRHIHAPLGYVRLLEVI